MTGVDASAGLLARFERDLAAEPAAVRGRVRAEQDLIEDYAERAGAARFPVVLCHGVLMYLADPVPTRTGGWRRCCTSSRGREHSRWRESCGRTCWRRRRQR